MIPAKPPIAWFLDPHLERREPLHVEVNGRVWGHAVGWDECHIGIQGQCVGAPRSQTGYAWFMRGEIETAEGECIPVGKLTMQTGHPSLEDSADEAVRHYDHTGMVAADIACGDDEYGVWVAGACRPHLTPAEIRELRAADISGDWRPGLARDIELVGLLAVNVPGFPAPRVAIAASGRRRAAVSLGVIPKAERVKTIAAAALIDGYCRAVLRP